MKDWQRLTLKIAFGEYQMRIFLHLYPPATFSVIQYIERQKTLHHSTSTPVLAPAASCSLTFPNTSFYHREWPPLCTKKHINCPQRAKRGAAEALCSIIIQFPNHHSTAKWVILGYIHVALSVRGYLILAVICSSATLNTRSLDPST